MIRNNQTLKPSKLRRRRRKIFAIKAVTVFLLLIGLVFLLSWFSKISRLQIENIEVSGNSSLSSDEIIDVMKKETSAKYFMIFSKNSIFLYPKQSIMAKLADDFKKIDSVSIKSKGLKTLAVSIAERERNALWCFSEAGEGSLIKNENSSRCYFLDKGGLVFSEAPDFSGNSFLRYYGLLDGTIDPIGENYMTHDRFKEVSRFVKSLEDLGINALEFQAESENDYAVNLKNGVKIIFDDKQPFDKTLENIQSILSEVDLKGEYSPTNPPKINYVDLRFGNKVYLKGE
ncbi:MAG: Cell division protein FtsQ [Parcubacteria group bacterium]|nr:Cell division protein FtsQ [Parcubacteria group bacterium]